LSNEEFLIPVAFDPIPQPHSKSSPERQRSPSKSDLTSPIDKFHTPRTGATSNFSDAHSNLPSAGRTPHLPDDNTLTSPFGTVSNASFSSSTRDHQLPASTLTSPSNSGSSGGGNIQSQSANASLYTDEHKNRDYFKLQDVPKRKKVGEGVSGSGSGSGSNNNLGAGLGSSLQTRQTSAGSAISSPNLPLRTTSLRSKPSSHSFKQQQQQQKHPSASASASQSSPKQSTSPASREPSPFRNRPGLAVVSTSVNDNNHGLSTSDPSSAITSSSRTPSTVSEFGYSLSRCMADEPHLPTPTTNDKTVSERASQMTLSPSTCTQDSTSTAVAGDSASGTGPMKRPLVPEVDITPFPAISTTGPGSTTTTTAATMAPSTAPTSKSQSRPGSSSKDQSLFSFGHLRRTSRGGSVGHNDFQVTPSPSLLRYSTGGDFSMDEDISRILSGDDLASLNTAASATSRDNESVATATTPNTANNNINNASGNSRGSIFKRMSDSMRHARSVSDKSSRTKQQQQQQQAHGHHTSASFSSPLVMAPGSAGGLPKSPTSPVPTLGSIAHEISSPSAMTTASMSDDVAWLKAELQRERNKNAEKEVRIAELEKAVAASQAGGQSSSAGAGNGNRTIDVSSRVAEVVDLCHKAALERLEQLRREASSSNAKPNEISEKAQEYLNEFSDDIENLKEICREEVDRLIQRRNDIMEEITEQEKQKQQCLQEFAQLSTKNAQLTDMNNEIVVQIRQLYKANSGNPGAAATAAAAQGVMSPPPPTAQPRFGKHSNDNLGMSSAFMHEEGTVGTAEHGPTVAVVQGPQVVNIRKGQPKKFTWKRGGQNVAKVTKGIRGAFTSRDGQPGGAGGAHNGNGNGAGVQGQGSHFVETPAYSSLPTVENGGAAMEQKQGGGGFGFFGNQKNKPKQSIGNAQISANGAAEQPELFGVDLVQRIEVEKKCIPEIVDRCINEVESRGMDVEGIYRKSGGSSQVQVIQQSFEKNSKDLNISDPEIDIHSVTSVLKQYFRKLPNPLITYDVYDLLLETADIEPAPARIEAMQRALFMLPRVHRDVLERLVFHLKKIIEHESENLMTSSNVAVVLAPTIMRPESLNREMVDYQRKNEALKFLVDYGYDIFMGMED
ncbi:hypothetical protein KEM56_000030, partial [Ascosphaera pollenicola]